MTGSMYAAVSGLKSHMNALNVIGNNVSNVNTTAYKATRYTFNEALYTTQRSGSDGTLVSGGRNPAQVGFGASIGTIDIDMSTKNYNPTGQLLDTMIDGDGFFFVGDKELGSGATAVSCGDEASLKGMNITRLGNFNIDPNGYLVDGNGSVVWGFLEEEADLTTQYNLGSGEIVVSTENNNNNNNNDPNATQPVVKELRDMTEDEIKKLQKLGVNLHNVHFETLTQDKYNELVAKNENTPDALTEEEKNLLARLGIDTGSGTEGKPAIKIGDSYLVSATVTQTSVMGAIRLMTRDKDTNTIEWPQYIAAKPVEYNTPNLPSSGVKSPAEPAKFVDGADTRLQADSVTIDEKSGAIRAMTSDGQIYTVGYLAIAKVTNPNGVTHVDGRYYQAADGAGTVRVTTIKGAVSGIKDKDGNVTGPESAGDTKLITGGLESSGTDLATEITNMITVQRGYQANTRIVTVTDSMLEELVNMKR
ncbi:MAG: flagellar hook protein FlgE [Oscillospiraceae bacterium]|nr:flagellar hook protein FlgE [Oscillospiraceae bacterium]